MTNRERAAEIKRLADLSGSLAAKVHGGGSRQQRQAWLAEQQEVAQQIAALRRAMQNRYNVPSLKRRRNESATRLNQAVQTRLSAGQRFATVSGLAREDLSGLHALMNNLRSMAVGYVPGFMGQRRPPENQVQQYAALQELMQPDFPLREVPKLQRRAVERNHAMWEAARELVEPDGIEDLLMRGFDAQVDTASLDLAADRMRNMMVPVRSEERPMVEQPRGPRTLPPIGDVRQAIGDWHTREREANRKMRALVDADLKLADYQALMEPELPLPTRHRQADVRAQQDVDQPPPMSGFRPAPTEDDVRAQQDADLPGLPGAPQRQPTFGEAALASIRGRDYGVYLERAQGSPPWMPEGAIVGEGVRKLWASGDVQSAVKGVVDFVKQRRDEAAAKLQEILSAQKLDQEMLAQLDADLQRVTAERDAAAPEDQQKYDVMVRTLQAGRMVMGRRLAARERLRNSYEAETIREDLILHADEIAEDDADLWSTEANIEQMFSGMPYMRRPEPESDPEEEAPDRYTVQAGDTLSAIARRFGTSVESLAKINNIADPDLIRPGQELSLTGAEQVGWVPRTARALYDLLPAPIRGWLTSVRDSPLVQRFFANRFESKPGDRSQPRGVRNNNPGNIRHGASKWDGMADEQKDSAFVGFKLPEYGIQASAELFNSYERYYGWQSLGQKITYWAPPQVWDPKTRSWVQENNTGAYIKSVARSMGLTLPADYEPRFQLLPIGAEPGNYPDRITRTMRGPDNRRWQIVNDETPEVSSHDPIRMEEFLKAVYLHENGQQPYSDEQLLVGMAMARRGNQFPGLLERLPIYAEEGRMAQAPSRAVEAPSIAQVRSGHNSRYHTVQNERERELNDALFEARREAIHEAANLYMALGYKDRLGTMDTEDRKSRADGMWHAWEAASLARQSGQMDDEAGQKMIAKADAAAWRAWRAEMMLDDLRKAGWPRDYSI